MIALGSSSSVQVGEPVVAIGAPLGLSGTATSGIVSALNRTVQVPGDNDSSALLVSASIADEIIATGRVTQETRRHDVNRLRQSWSFGQGDGHPGRAALSWRQHLTPSNVVDA